MKVSDNSLKTEIYDTKTGKYYPASQEYDLKVYRNVSDLENERYVWAFRP